MVRNIFLHACIMCWVSVSRLFIAVMKYPRQTFAVNSRYRSKAILQNEYPWMLKAVLWYCLIVFVYHLWELGLVRLSDLISYFKNVYWRLMWSIPRSSPKVMLSVLSNKRESKAFVRDRGRFTRRPSGRHRFRYIQQTDKGDGRHSEGKVENSNQGPFSVKKKKKPRESVLIPLCDTSALLVTTHLLLVNANGHRKDGHGHLIPASRECPTS